MVSDDDGIRCFHPFKLRSAPVESVLTVAGSVWGPEKDRGLTSSPRFRL
jgi:hypothetical protein